MKEIKCPKCGTVITVDDADFASLLSQVRTEEFNAELNRRLEDYHRIQKAREAENAAQEAAKAAMLAARHKEELSGKEMEIERLRQQIASWENSKKLEMETVWLKAKDAASEEIKKKETELMKKGEEI